MASQKKKNKLKNTNLCKGGLKNKTPKLKGVMFFTSSQRQHEKQAHSSVG